MADFLLNGLLVSNYSDSGIFDLNKIESLKYVKQPNSAHRYCYALNDTMKKHIKTVLESYYADIREYFDENFVGFEMILGFITINSPNSTNGVNLHRDNTDYTFNMFLNNDYNGGSILYSGKSDKVTKKYVNICKRINDNYMHSVKPIKNNIIIHRGYNAHQVEKVTSGIRYNLILWCYENETNNMTNLNDFFI